jgi:threonine 3-dehydrogenase
VISADTNPGGGTTDYAVSIFHEALQYGSFECYLKPDTRLPMMYIDDCLNSLINIMEAPAEQLKQRTYNVNAIDFTPAELISAIKKYVPNLTVTFKPDGRQDIGIEEIDKVTEILKFNFFLLFLADSWPQSLDDSNARRDWGWNHVYNMEELCHVMFTLLSKKYNSPYINRDFLNNKILDESQGEDSNTYAVSAN